MADKARLEKARAALHEVYRDPSADPEELVEALEQLMDDLGMYLGRVTEKLEQRADDAETRAHDDGLPDPGEGRDLEGERARRRALQAPAAAEDLEPPF